MLYGKSYEEYLYQRDYEAEREWRAMEREADGEREQRELEKEEGAA
jgi:hypothetical protein